MSDGELRRLERRWLATGAVPDQAAWLAARVRAGALDADLLGLAALLGDEAALLAGGAPRPDPFAGRDQAGWERVAAYRASGDLAELRPLLVDPARAVDCGHDRDSSRCWRHRLLDVVLDERTGACVRLARCWQCGERIQRLSIPRSHAGREAGVPLELRGLHLLEYLACDEYDRPDLTLACEAAGRRWVAGLGAYGLEVSLRAGAAAAAEGHLGEVEGPWRASDQAERELLELVLAWAARPDDARFEALTRRADSTTEEELDTAWADLLVETIRRTREAVPEAELGALARRPLHRLGRRLDDDERLRACVRRALVPWALGSSGSGRAALRIRETRSA